MANQIALQTVTLRDARGHIGRTRFYYQYDTAVSAAIAAARGSVDALLTLLEALSNAAVVSVGGLASIEHSPLSYGAAPAVYQTCEDKAVMTYLAGAAGPSRYTLSRVAIPAPILAMFEADAESVNLGYAAVAAFSAAMLAVDGSGGRVVTKGGLPLVNTVSGTLARRKLQRKLSIYDKSANLDEPEE